MSNFLMCGCDYLLLLTTQISDIHLCYHRENGVAEDLHSFCSDTLDTIQPSLVLATGMVYNVSEPYLVLLNLVSAVLTRVKTTLQSRQISIPSLQATSLMPSSLMSGRPSSSRWSGTGTRRHWKDVE